MNELSRLEPSMLLPSFRADHAFQAILTAPTPNIPQLGDPDFDKPLPMRCAGLAAILQGLAMMIGCVLVDVWAFDRLAKVPSAETFRWVVVAFGGVGTVLGLLLFIGGFLLISARFGGRALPMIYAWSVAPLMLGGMFALAIALTSQQSGNALLTWIFWFHSGIAAGGMLFGVVIGWLLMTGSSARWMDVRRGRIPSSLAAGASRLLCVSALLSLIFAFMPPPIVMQVASLILGICAMGIIRRSGGNRWGRGMAITGCLISLFALVAVATLSAGATVRMVLDDSAKQNESILCARLNELNLAQHVYQQMALAPGGSNAECSSSLTELLHSTAAISPVEDSDELIAADRATLGEAARPYHGYYFKLTTWADVRPDDPAPNWVIFAWPARRLGSSHSALMLEPGDSSPRALVISGEPPSDPTHDQIEISQVIK